MMPPDRAKREGGGGREFERELITGALEQYAQSKNMLRPTILSLYRPYIGTSTPIFEQ